MPGLLDNVGNTVLVLGAGASAPYGFPLGPELRDKILSSDERRAKLLAAAGVADDSGMQSTLSYFQARSIDEYFALYSDHASVAKLMIAYHLMECEDALGSVNPRLQDHWYKDLFDLVLGNDPKVGSRKLAILTFNYDLSLEVFLVRTLMARHRIDNDEARRRIAENLLIIHLHGHVGDVRELHGRGRHYQEITVQGLQEAASRILTIEEAERRPIWTVAHEMLKDARNIGFIGFGFDPTNLARLQLQNHCAGRARVFLAQCGCPTLDGLLARIAPGVKVHGPREFRLGQQPSVSKLRWIFDEAAKQEPLQTGIDRPKHALT